MAAIHPPYPWQEAGMADDPKKRAPQDALRVNIHEDHEVRYWTAKFNVTPERLAAAVKAAGPMAKDVEEQLRKS
jgi:hypothetical protein